jgi:hypothetical protein
MTAGMAFLTPSKPWLSSLIRRGGFPARREKA